MVVTMVFTRGLSLELDLELSPGAAASLCLRACILCVLAVDPESPTLGPGPGLLGVTKD